MGNHLFIDIAAAQPETPSMGEYQEDETILISTQSTQTDKAVKEKSKLDAATKALAKVRTTLEPVAQAARLEAAKKGNFASKVLFQGAKQRAIFTFTNAFSTLDMRMKSALGQIIGEDNRDLLFEKEERISLRPDKAKELFKILSAKGLDPTDFLSEETCLRFKKDFRRTRFDLRSQLSDHANDVLDQVMDGAASKPSLNTK